VSTDRTIVTAAKAIRRTWKAIASHCGDLPEVSVAIRDQGPPGHQVVVVDEHDGHMLWVARSAIHTAAHELLAALIHAAVDCSADVTSRQGRYHNERFAVIAGWFGLNVERSQVHGWVDVGLSEDARRLYRTQIADLAEHLPSGPVPVVPSRSAVTGRVTSNGPLSARCGCNRLIKVSRRTLAVGPIVCGVCRELFVCLSS